MRLIYFFLIIIAASSCNSYKTKYPYSPNDFRAELRPELEKIVINGGTCATYFDEDDNTRRDKFISLVDSGTSENELQKLTACEHPVLRAYAFKILCRRKSPLVSNILLNHLDDTAIISYCRGEFGEDYTTVSDYFLDQSEGKTTLLKADVIKTVITKHPYLLTAASVFTYPKDSMKQYYQELKDIILKDYPLHYRYGYQLIAKLSEYKKDIDTGFIKKSLEERWRDNEQLKFQVIENNPVSSYFFAVEKFYVRLLGLKYRKLLQIEFLHNEKFTSAFNQFIDATTSYRSKRGAEIIQSILQKKLYPDETSAPAMYHEGTFYSTLLDQLKKYDCDYYAKIKKTISPKAIAFNKKYRLKMETYIDTADFKPSVTW
jgi:hypothetical protein